MKAVVLAGGEGTRLRPLTLTTPKPLLPIANRPFLEHQLAWLAGHGVDEVVLSIGYRPDAFIEHFGDPGRFGGLTLRYATEPEPLGTAGAIRFAAGPAGGWADGRLSERFLVCNGDVLTDLDVTSLVAFHHERGAEATISLTRVDDPSAFGVVPTDKSGRVLGFVEKPAPGTAPTDWVNAGTYVLEPSVLDLIPDGRSVSIERETFPAIVGGSGRMYAQPSPASWLDIGTPAKYLQANLDALGAQTVLAAGDAEIAPTAKIDRAVLGAGARIGDGVSVTCSVVMAGAVVEAGACVADSVVGFGARVGRGAVVANETLVGLGAVVEENSHLSGARLP